MTMIENDESVGVQDGSVLLDSSFVGKRKFDATDENFENYEYVMVVPKKLTKHAQNVIYSCQATPLRYHLEGRFGSRTHIIDDSHMGLPLTSGFSLADSKAQLERIAAQHDDLGALISSDGVRFTFKPYHEPASHRARPPPPVDARIHPERAPKGMGSNEFWQKFVKKIKVERSRIESPLMNQSQNVTVMEHVSGSSFRKERNRFTYAELFAGMGGFGVALDHLGGECIFVSEIEDHLRKLYHHNFVNIPNKARQVSDGCTLKEEAIDIPIHGDIYQVTDDSLPSDEHGEKKSTSLDLLVGGFPCQPFSALGQQPGFSCPKGNLFLEIVRVLRVSKPKAFLLENVPGLVGMEDTLKTIIKALENEGYCVTSEVCSARGLTVTGRKRLFLVGLRKKEDENDRDRNDDKSSKFEFPFIPDLDLTLSDVLDYDTLPEEELEILRLSDTTFHQLLTNKRWRPSRLAWPNVKGDTLTSHYGNSVGRGESQLVPSSAPHPPRRFSIREMARMMGFPNSYEFLPPRPRQSAMAYRKEQYRAIGNAVCPPLIAAISGAILDKCLDVRGNGVNWVTRGRDVAVRLALAATRSQPAEVPRGCLPPTTVE